MAEWLGSALQKLLQRFESASDLNRLQSPKQMLGAFLCPSQTPELAQDGQDGRNKSRRRATRVAAQGERRAIAVSEDPTDPVIGFPWSQGFGPPSAWPRPPGVAWNGAQAAWNPRSHVLGLAYRCLDPVNAYCEWGMRTWSPWAETRLHK